MIIISGRRQYQKVYLFGKRCMCNNFTCDTWLGSLMNCDENQLCTLWVLAPWCDWNGMSFVTLMWLKWLGNHFSHIRVTKIMCEKKERRRRKLIIYLSCIAFVCCPVKRCRCSETQSRFWPALWKICRHTCVCQMWKSNFFKCDFLLLFFASVLMFVSVNYSHQITSDIRAVCYDDTCAVL